MVLRFPSWSQLGIVTCDLFWGTGWINIMPSVITWDDHVGGRCPAFGYTPQPLVQYLQLQKYIYIGNLSLSLYICQLSFGLKFNPAIAGCALQGCHGKHIVVLFVIDLIRILRMFTNGIEYPWGFSQ